MPKHVVDADERGDLVGADVIPECRPVLHVLLLAMAIGTR
jgi:hypothetical protein